VQRHLSSPGVVPSSAPSAVVWTAVFFWGPVCLPVLLSTAELSSCFHRILEIIITLTKVNKTAMSHLYKLGAFEILLWKLLASDIVDGDKSRITKFLSQTHLLQVFLLQLAFCLILL
jgi:hypothetical protein